MLFHVGKRRLQYADVEKPMPQAGQVLIKIAACGVCRTDLHIVDGELSQPKQPLVPGHEIVGRIEQLGTGAAKFQIRARVGVPWMGYTCGVCNYCQTGRENLCVNPQFTGYTLDGGYAQFVCADENFCFAIPDGYSDVAAAPLLCAGLIGYRSWRMTGDARRVGIYGFGAAAHIITQVAKHQGREVYAFAKRRHSGHGFRQTLRRRVGGGLRNAAARRIGRGNYLRPCRRFGADGTAGRGTRRYRRLWRHPHVRHPEFSVRAAVGRANGSVGCKLDSARREGVLDSGNEGTDSNGNNAVSVRSGE